MWETTASQRCDRRMPTLLNCSRLATKSVLHHHLGQAELHWELALLTCCNCWKTTYAFRKAKMLREIHVPCFREKQLCIHCILS